MLFSFFQCKKLSNFAVFIVCPFATVCNEGLVSDASDTIRAQESEHSDEGRAGTGLPNSCRSGARRDALLVVHVQRQQMQRRTDELHTHRCDQLCDLVCILLLETP